MRILLANYRYFLYGGPERYLFAVQRGLDAKGHETIPFSIAYPRNRPTPYDRYFVRPLAGADEIRFEQHSWSPASVLRTLERSFYSPEVRRSVERLIRDTRPDVAYILHFLKKLSPSLLVGIKSMGTPIVVRLSDLLLICPEAHLTRDGQPCSLCVRGALWPSIRYRCVRGSLAASLVHFFASHYHRLRRFFELVDLFVVPSETTRDLMVEAGWPREKFRCIPTFVDQHFFVPPDSRNQNANPYILYVGHLESHKGVDVLLRAYAEALRYTGDAAPRLKIAAEPATRFGGVCRDLAASLEIEDHVDFLGFVSGEDLPALYRDAHLTIVPSTCYENMPNALGESYAAGTPVIGSRHGSIAPLIEEDITGRTFEPGSVEDLARRLADSWNDAEWLSQAGRAAREYALANLGEHTHIQTLVGVLQGARDAVSSDLTQNLPDGQE